mmetsp:Transcript_54907/g.157896  ORF Transcript_54907/g.157896 Transcript_54907/m.157896 type:complete len:218 (+) Transcript_54907:113-766(+)
MAMVLRLAQARHQEHDHRQLRLRSLAQLPDLGGIVHELGGLGEGAMQGLLKRSVHKEPPNLPRGSPFGEGAAGGAAGAPPPTRPEAGGADTGARRRWSGRCPGGRTGRRGGGRGRGRRSRRDTQGVLRGAIKDGQHEAAPALVATERRRDDDLPASASGAGNHLVEEVLSPLVAQVLPRFLLSPPSAGECRQQLRALCQSLLCQLGQQCGAICQSIL